jgi:hypothetical protein
MATIEGGFLTGLRQSLENQEGCEGKEPARRLQEIAGNATCIKLGSAGDLPMSLVRPEGEKPPAGLTAKGLCIIL